MKRTKKALGMLVLLAFVMFALPMTVFAASKPKITKQPVAVTAYNQGTATFKVTATGAKSYQWQYRTSTTGKWMNATATGNKTATLKVGATIERHGNQYRCAVKNATGTTYSNAVKLTVKFKTNPSNPTITAGKTQTFKVLTGCKAYQWQYRKTPTGTWMNATATGNKTATLKVPATVSKNGYQYRCKVTTKRGVIYSDASKLNVVQPTLAVTKHPVDQTAKIGSAATFSITGTAVSAYQWEWYDAVNGVWNNATGTGNKTASLKVTVAAAYDGRQYRCKVTDANGLSQYSNTATLKVFGVKTHPEAYVGGTTAVFKVDALGVSSYQWQYRTPSTETWANATATGNKTAILSVPATASRDGYQYRCKMTSANGTVFYSNAAKLTYVEMFTFVNSTSGTLYVAKGEVFELKATVSGGVAPYKVIWTKEGTDGGSFEVTSKTSVVTYTKTCTTSDFDGCYYWDKAVDALGNEITNPNAAASKVYIEEYEKLTAGTDVPKACLAEGIVNGSNVMVNITPSIVKYGTGDLSYEWQYAPGATAKGSLTDGSWKKLPIGVDATNEYGAMLSTNGMLFSVKNSESFLNLLGTKGIWIRCKVTDNIKGTVVYTPVGGIYQDQLTVTPSIAETKYGKSYIGISATATGGMGSYTYQWKSTTTGYDVFAEYGISANGLSISVPYNAYKGSNVGRGFYCTITDSLGNTKDTKVVTCMDQAFQ